MAIYFSKSVNGFFSDDVHEKMPNDCKEVSEAAWQHLIANQSGTSVIAGDDQGNPILVNPEAGNAVVYTSVGVG